MYVHSVALILNFASVASGELELTINSIFFPSFADLLCLGGKYSCAKGLIRH